MRRIESIGGAGPPRSECRRSNCCGRSTMDPMRLADNFRDILSLLNARQVEYLVIGRYAVAYHGVPPVRGTLELWISDDLPNTAKVVDILRRFGDELPELVPPGTRFNRPRSSASKVAQGHRRSLELRRSCPIHLGLRSRLSEICDAGFSLPEPDEARGNRRTRLFRDTERPVLRLPDPGLQWSSADMEG